MGNASIIDAYVPFIMLWWQRFHLIPQLFLRVSYVILFGSYVRM